MASFNNVFLVMLQVTVPARLNPHVGNTLVISQLKQDRHEKRNVNSGRHVMVKTKLHDEEEAVFVARYQSTFLHSCTFHI